MMIINKKRRRRYEVIRQNQDIRNMRCQRGNAKNSQMHMSPNFYIMEKKNRLSWIYG